MNEEWKVNGVKDSVDCHIFNVERVEKTNPDGKVGDYIKIKSPDWALAIIKAANDKYILVNQYRHGSDTYLTEFPCGIVEKNENPMDAAIREAEEEAGLNKSKIISIRKVYENKSNPGFMSNSMFAYFIETEQYAIDFLSDKSKQDKDEFINLIILEKDEVDRIMKDKDTSALMRLAWEEAKKYTNS